MKLVLLAILLISHESYCLKSSRHYKFKYFSNFKTEIPAAGNQAAGLSLKAIIEVYVENSDGIAIFKLSNVTTVKFNEDLGCNRDTDFADGRFGPPKDQNFSTALQQTFRVNLRGSNPFAIEYEETEHNWLLNIQKGIALMFKNEILKGNFETQVEDSVSSLFHQGHVVNSFSVEEETIFGICSVNYQIHQIHDPILARGNGLLPTSEDNLKDDLWQVDRSIDFDNCREKVAMHIHATNEKRNKKKLSFTRSSASKFVLRGSPAKFELYSALVEGITSFPLSHFDEGETQATATQRLILIDESDNEETPTMGPNLKRSETWMFQVWSAFQAPKEGNTHPWVVYSGENVYHKDNEVYGTRSFTPEEISATKAKVMKSLQAASNAFTDFNQKAAESEWSVVESLLMVVYQIKTLPKQDILDIFQQIFESNIKIEKKLLLDTAAISGSYNAFEVIMDYISEGKIEVFQIREIFEILTRSSDGNLNITRIMDYALNLDLSTKVEAPTVLLNVAHYLSEFCINKYYNHMPVKGPFQEDCVLVTEKFIPYLKGIIYNESLSWERAFAVKALELLRSHFSFEILSPIIDGRMESPKELKSMALLALKNQDQQHQDQKQSVLRTPVMNLLKEVYANPEQDFQVRAAALMSYASWHPSASFWYDLARSTWHDPSSEFSAFAHSLIKLYAVEKVTTNEKQREDASFALKLAKIPVKNEGFLRGLFNFLFKNYARFILLVAGERRDINPGYFFTEILSEVEDLSLLKLENVYLNLNEGFYFNKTKEPFSLGSLPMAKQFFDNFRKEINLKFHPQFDEGNFMLFVNILEDSFVTWSLRERFGFLPFVQDANDKSVLYSGRHFNFFDKTHFHPNELGLPVFTFSAMSATFFITAKSLPKNHGEVFSYQALIKGSGIYSKGITVYVPWTFESYMPIDTSSVELTLPVEFAENRHVVNVGGYSRPKAFYNIAFPKTIEKFPLFRLSRNLMTATFIMDPLLDEIATATIQSVKKLDMQEKTISEVHPFTGIKYDLVMKADSANSLSFLDLLKFPKIPFKVWSLALYLNSRESQTQKLIVNIQQEHLKKSEAEKEENSNQEYQSISVNDSPDERSQKLTNAMGARGRYLGFKFNFTGEHERIYNIFYVASDSGDPNGKVIVGFARGETPGKGNHPLSICFESRWSLSTSLPNGHFLLFLSGKNFTDRANFKVLLNCSRPLLTINALYSMSEEGRAETTGDCNSKYDNTDINTAYNLIYDNIDINASFENAAEWHHLGIPEDILPMIKNWLSLPFFKSFTEETPERKIKLRIHRNVYNKMWDLHLKGTGGDVLLTTFPDNSLLKIVTGISKFSPDFVMNKFFLEASYSPEKCTLQHNSVTTFDGVHYSYKPSKCWTLASHSMPRYDPVDKNVLMIRVSQGGQKVPDFKYIMFRKGLEVEFSNNELKVNGAVVDKITDFEPDIKTILKDLIYKSGNHYLITYESEFRYSMVVSSDKIEIYSDNLGENMYGICGNDDGRISPEFIGPKHCVYKAAQMFVASWTGRSDECDSAALKDYRKEVGDYQADCKAFDYQDKNIELSPRCLFFGWKVLKTNESNYCVSTNPLPFCLDSCQKSEHTNVQVKFNCWKEENAPAQLKKSIENDEKISIHPVIAEAFSVQELTTQIATLCQLF